MAIEPIISASLPSTPPALSPVLDVGGNAETTPIYDTVMSLYKAIKFTHPSDATKTGVYLPLSINGGLVYIRQGDNLVFEDGSWVGSGAMMQRLQVASPESVDYIWSHSYSTDFVEGPFASWWQGAPITVLAGQSAPSLLPIDVESWTLSDGTTPLALTVEEVTFYAVVLSVAPVWVPPSPPIVAALGAAPQSFGNPQPVI